MTKALTHVASGLDAAARSGGRTASDLKAAPTRHGGRFAGVACSCGRKPETRGVRSTRVGVMPRSRVEMRPFRIRARRALRSGLRVGPGGGVG